MDVGEGKIKRLLSIFPGLAYAACSFSKHVLNIYIYNSIGYLFFGGDFDIISSFKGTLASG